MNRTYLHLALASALMATTGIARSMATEGGGGSPAPAGPLPPADTGRVAYIVHKEGEADTLELSPSGRILTEPFERPEWAGSAVLAMLYERNTFYQTRLGAELAEPLMQTNLINFDDLSWVIVDEDTGLEDVLSADDEFRQGVLAVTLGIDRETGDIEGSIADHYIDRDSKGYTLAEIIDKKDADEVFGNGQQQTATGSGQ